jgi:hypothetical protein
MWTESENKWWKMKKRRKKIYFCSGGNIAFKQRGKEFRLWPD